MLKCLNNMSLCCTVFFLTMLLTIVEFLQISGYPDIPYKSILISGFDIGVFFGGLNFPNMGPIPTLWVPMDSSGQMQIRSGHFQSLGDIWPELECRKDPSFQSFMSSWDMTSNINLLVKYCPSIG